jgi:signal transduction histidine kinase
VGRYGAGHAPVPVRSGHTWPERGGEVAGLFDVAFDGLAVLDDRGRYLYVNPAGYEILGAAALEGRASFLPADALAAADKSVDSADAAESTVTTVTRFCRGSADREIEFRHLPLGPEGSAGLVVAFRDVTESRLRERQLAAFARASESVAFGGSLRDTLDMICDEIVQSTGLAGGQILLIGQTDLRLQVHGAAPAATFPPDFAIRLDEARRRGAELKSLIALRTRHPVVAPHRKAEMLASREWEPLHDHLNQFEWDSFVSAPLLSHGRPIGALNVYYRPGHDPTEADVAFVGSMADQAAIAVQNARHIAESKGRAVLDERYRLARDLHDSACQELFSLTLELRAATRALDRGRLTDDASIRARLAVLEQLAYAALGDMRALVYELHPTLLHAEGLAAAVRREAESITAREPLQIQLSAPDERLPLETAVELDLYRLLKEALHNAVKHAGATSIHVTLGEEPAGSRRLVVEVSDDGVGFDPRHPSEGLGLVSMRERAERVGGQLTLTSRPGVGTTVRVLVPDILPEGTPSQGMPTGPDGAVP